MLSHSLKQAASVIKSTCIYHQKLTFSFSSIQTFMVHKEQEATNNIYIVIVVSEGDCIMLTAFCNLSWKLSVFSPTG